MTATESDNSTDSAAPSAIFNARIGRAYVCDWVTLETEGTDRPALIAEWISQAFF